MISIRNRLAKLRPEVAVLEVGDKEVIEDRMMVKMGLRSREECQKEAEIITNLQREQMKKQTFEMAERVKDRGDQIIKRMQNKLGPEVDSTGKTDEAWKTEIIRTVRNLILTGRHELTQIKLDWTS